MLLSCTAASLSSDCRGSLSRSVETTSAAVEIYFV